MTQALWIAMIANICGVLTVWGKAYFDYKARKGSSKKSDQTNNPQRYQKQGEDIASIKTDLKGFKEYVKTEFVDIKDDIKRLFSKYNGMKK